MCTRTCIFIWMFAQGSDKKEWPPTTRGHGTFWENTDGLVQDCSGSSVLAMELLQSCAQPSSLSTSDRSVCQVHIDGMVWEVLGSSALAMELRPSCTRPSIWKHIVFVLAVCDRGHVDNIGPTPNVLAKTIHGRNSLATYACVQGVVSCKFLYLPMVY